MDKTNRIKFLTISIVLMICTSLSAEKQDSAIYNAPQGLFSVKIPSGCEIEEIEGPPKKVLFTYANNSIVVIAEQYKEHKTITETEKNRIRDNMGPSMETTFSSKITNIHEAIVKISEAEGWIYSFTIPTQGFYMDMVYFIKNAKLYSIVSTRVSDQDRTWQEFLSTFKTQSIR